MSEDLINNLVLNLEKISIKYSSFIELLKTERDYIIHSKYEEYGSLVTNKITLSKEIEHIDNEIDALINKLKIIHNMTTVNLNAILQIAPLSMRDEIALLKDSLKNTLEVVRSENKLNESLLADKIDFAKKIMENISKNKNETFYLKNGNKKPIDNKDSGFINRTV